MKANLLITACGLLASPIMAAETAPDSNPLPIPETPEVKADKVPEPSPLLFAGLGGFVLLMCAVRRK